MGGCILIIAIGKGQDRWETHPFDEHLIDGALEIPDDAFDDLGIQLHETLQLEYRCLEPECEARIFAVRQQGATCPCPAPLGAAENIGKSGRQLRSAHCERMRHEGETRKRRPAHEFRSGDEDDGLSIEVFAHGIGRNARLAGIHHQRKPVAELRAQRIDFAQLGQDQPGLRTVNHMQKRVLASLQCAFDFRMHRNPDIATMARRALFASYRDIDERYRADPGHIGARLRLDAERGFARKELAARRQDTATADFVCAKQDVVSARSTAPGHCRQRHELQVGARGGEDDVHTRA